MPVRRTALLALSAAGVAAALTAASFSLGDAASSSRPSRPSAAADATVLTTRGDLQQREDVTGTLAYGSPTEVAGRRSGTITWLPSVGTVVSRDGILWRVDDSPVVLLYGALPLYRTLRTSARPASGADVDLLAANLHALGLWHGATRAARYDGYLAEAVKSWQRLVGSSATGVVRPGDVVVATGPVRIDSVTAHVAETADQPVLAITSRARRITVKVPTALAQSLASRQRIDVVLPDRHSVMTHVARIGSKATGDGTGTTDALTVAVAVPHDSQSALDGSELGPVTAQIVVQSDRDVVQVPVGALLALAGGGYALQRVDGRLVPVEIGLVADGRVEVHGIAAGVRVRAAS